MCALPSGTKITYYEPSGAITFGSDPYSLPGSATAQTGKVFDLELGPGTYSAAVTIGVPGHNHISGPRVDGGGLATIQWTGGDQTYQTDGTYTWTIPLMGMGCPNNENATSPNDFCYNHSGSPTNHPGVQIEHMVLDCLGAKNVSGLVSVSSQELSWAQNMTIKDCMNDYNTTGTNGTGLTNDLRIGGNPTAEGGNSAENSGPWGPFNLFWGTNGRATAIALRIEKETNINMDSHITFNGGSGAIAPPNVCAAINGSGIKMGSLHFQSCGTYGLEIGALNASVANRFGTITGNNVPTMVHISNNFANSGSIQGVMSQGSTTNTLVDSWSGNTFTTEVPLYPYDSVTGTMGAGGQWNANSYCLWNGDFCVNANGQVNASLVYAPIGIPSSSGNSPVYLGEQSANGNDTFFGYRQTDTSPTGYFLRFQNHALSSTLFSLDVNGNLVATSNTTGQLNQSAANSFAGSCSMSSGTTCTFSSTAAFTNYLGFVSLDPTATPPATAISGSVRSPQER